MTMNTPKFENLIKKMVHGEFIFWKSDSLKQCPVNTYYQDSSSFCENNRSIPLRNQWYIILKKGKRQWTRTGPIAHAHELIFKSIYLIAWKSVARQADSEFRIAIPNILCPSPPAFPKQSRHTYTKKKHQRPDIPVTFQLLTQGSPMQRPWGCVSIMGYLASCKNVLLS